jgi:hypothetical protein
MTNSAEFGAPKNVPVQLSMLRYCKIESVVKRVVSQTGRHRERANVVDGGATGGGGETQRSAGASSMVSTSTRSFGGG